MVGFMEAAEFMEAGFILFIILFRPLSKNGPNGDGSGMPREKFKREAHTKKDVVVTISGQL